MSELLYTNVTMLFILICVLGAVSILALYWVYVLYKKLENKNVYLPYVKKSYLMTNAERNFFNVLQDAVGDTSYVVPQVALDSIVEVNKYEVHTWKYKNRIDRKRLDFVLFDRQYFTPQLVIELDDVSHALPLREERDHFIDAVLEKVGLQIEHIKTSYSYSKDDLIKICNLESRNSFL